MEEEIEIKESVPECICPDMDECSCEDTIPSIGSQCICEESVVTLGPCDVIEGLTDSIKQLVNRHQNMTVKFLLDEPHVVAQVYPSEWTIEEVLKDIGCKFDIYYKFLTLEQTIDDNKIDIPFGFKLYEVCRNDHGIIEAQLKLSELGNEHNENYPEKPIILDVEVYYRTYKLPDIISVYLPIDESGEGAAKRLVVEISNNPIVKPFLGGYLNTKNNTEYLDAFSQTGPAYEHIKWDGVVSRDTQTHELRQKGQETHYDRSTQAFGDAPNLIYIPKISDYCITPRPYETYEQMVRRINKLGKIKLIQRNFRRYMWQKLIKESAAEWRRLCSEHKRRKDKRFQNYLNRFKRECIVRTFPKTKEDFTMLLTQVQKWKEEEVKKINELYSGGPRIAALNCLLDKEVVMLNGIQRQKMLIYKYMQSCRTEAALDKLGETVKWIGYRNIVCEMDLIRTQRARYLTGYYRKLKLQMTPEKRLELLNEVSGVIDKEESNASLVDRIEELFNRERNLLVRQVPYDELVHLRDRQLVLFVDLIKDLKNYVPPKPDTKICEKCKSVLPIKEFVLHTKQNELNTCKTCASLKVPAVDLSIYRSILRVIRRDERKRNALASYAFIMQEEDMHDLVEKIWHGHSILSQCDIRMNLRLPRWNRGDDWSPWNCICLTEQEARAHSKISILENVYENHLIENIMQKHHLAKLTFKKLFKVDFDFVESGEWWKVGLDGKTV